MVEAAEAIEAYHVALGIEDAAVHRFLGELARCEAGTGKSEDYVWALDMLRIAHDTAAARRAVMRETVL